MIVLPAPNPICGDDLVADLADAGFPGATVALVEGTVEITGIDDDADVSAVVASHVPRPLPDPPIVTVADVRQALAATDLAPPVKDALASVLDAVEATSPT